MRARAILLNVRDLALVTASAFITASIVLLCIEAFRLWRRQRCAAYVVLLLIHVCLFLVYKLSYVLLEAFS